jgi:hypothetical protein
MTRDATEELLMTVVQPAVVRVHPWSAASLSVEALTDAALKCPRKRGTPWTAAVIAGNLREWDFLEGSVRARRL